VDLVEHFAVDWILATQHDNGSWGLAGGTLEETGYALMVVADTHTYVVPAGHRGMRFVRQRWPATGCAHPELWIGKVL
jgi:hypothetical protein